MFYFCSGDKLLVGQTFLSDCKEQTRMSVPPFFISGK